MNQKKKNDDDNENIYELKIKEEDMRRGRLFKKEKERIENSLKAGIILALPVILLCLFIYIQTKELDVKIDEKNKEELKRILKRENTPKIKVKQLYR